MAAVSVKRSVPSFTIIENVRKGRRISLSLFEVGYFFGIQLRESSPIFEKSKRVEIIAVNGFNEREFTFYVVGQVM